MERRIVSNFDDLALSPLRDSALRIVEAGLAAINTKKVLKDTLSFEEGILKVRGDPCATQNPERIFFIGVGKCAVDAALAVEEILGNRLSGGVALDVFVPEEKSAGLRTIEYCAGTHPLPSPANIAGAARIVHILGDLTEKDIALILVSGGGSTLLCKPPSGLTSIDEADVFKKLTRSGASIQDINTVRKHLSELRGGGLARAAYPAEVVSLIISDVPGNDLSFVASGPTVRDETTVDDARSVLLRFGVAGGETAPLLETPKEDKYFTRVRNVLLVDNVRALRAMEDEAMHLGFSASIVTSRMTGHAKETGEEIIKTLHGVSSKSALLWGGETTVTLGEKGGDGGRNQEMAIAMLPFVKEGEIVIPFASDGRDNCEAAGGICDRLTVSHARSGAVSIEESLRAHLSYTFFKNTGDLVMTGETGSNVSDLIVALKQ